MTTHGARMLIKVVAVQAQMGRRLTIDEKIHLFKQRPDFVCLPEYWLIDETVVSFEQAAKRKADHLEYLMRLSDDLRTCVIGGTVVESEEGRLHNACYVINRGVIIGRYLKRYPVPGEQERGISPGKGNLVLTVDGVRIGLMICGDVFFPHMYEELGGENTDIIFIPTTSPYRPADSVSEKRQRDVLYFLDGARISGSYVVKVCGVGTLFGKPLHGRSLVAAPWEILNRVPFTAEANVRLLTETLDIDENREFRHKLALINAPSREIAMATSRRA